MAKSFARQFYKSREWAAVRRYCMMRDNYLCRKCGRPAEEVHHIEHLTAENITDVRVSLNPDNLISLCRDCHFREHIDDQADGRQHKYARNIIPKIVFDAEGNPIAPPRGDYR